MKVAIVGGGVMGEAILGAALERGLFERSDVVVAEVVAERRRALEAAHRVTTTAVAGEAAHLPRGVAHGFLTLTDGVELFYQMSEEYKSELQRGARWNDPAFAIAWPSEPLVMSQRDRDFPDFVEGDR